MGNHSSNKRAKRKYPSFPPARRRPRSAPGLRGLGRLGARTSVSAGLLVMSVAGAAAPVALAGTNPPAPPGDTGKPAPPALLGLPDSWGGTAGAPAVVLPLSPPEPATPPAGSATPQAAETGDQLDRWIDQAVDIMRQQGIPVSAADAPHIRTIIEKESDGDPHAVNHWDSNARAGHPSKGLMQCIDQTFEANKLAGHDDIFNPVDNIIAGVRYTISRYGGFDRHPGLLSLGRGGGYRGY